MTRFNKGLLFGVSAYLIWGALPLYWKLVEEAGAYEILAHRGIWSLLLCVLLLALRKQIKSAFVMVRASRTLSLLFLASGLLTINWGVYIWSDSEPSCGGSAWLLHNSADQRHIWRSVIARKTTSTPVDRGWAGLRWRSHSDRGIRRVAMDCPGSIDLMGQLQLD